MTFGSDFLKEEQQPLCPTGDRSDSSSHTVRFLGNIVSFEKQNEQETAKVSFDIQPNATAIARALKAVFIRPGDCIWNAYLFESLASYYGGLFMQFLCDVFTREGIAFPLRLQLCGFPPAPGCERSAAIVHEKLFLSFAEPLEGNGVAGRISPVQYALGTPQSYKFIWKTIQKELSGNGSAWYNLWRRVKGLASTRFECPSNEEQPTAPSKHETDSRVSLDVVPGAEPQSAPQIAPEVASGVTLETTLASTPEATSEPAPGPAKTASEKRDECKDGNSAAETLCSEPRFGFPELRALYNCTGDKNLLYLLGRSVPEGAPQRGSGAAQLCSAGQAIAGESGAGAFARKQSSFEAIAPTGACLPGDFAQRAPGNSSHGDKGSGYRASPARSERRDAGAFPGGFCGSPPPKDRSANEPCSGAVVGDSCTGSNSRASEPVYGVAGNVQGSHRARNSDAIERFLVCYSRHYCAIVKQALSETLIELRGGPRLAAEVAQKSLERVRSMPFLLSCSVEKRLCHEHGACEAPTEALRYNQQKNCVCLVYMDAYTNVFLQKLIELGSQGELGLQGECFSDAMRVLVGVQKSFSDNLEVFDY